MESDLSQSDSIGIEAYDRHNESLTRRLMERERELKRMEEEQEERIAFISQQAQQLEREIATRKKEIQDYKSREQQASLQIQEVLQIAFQPLFVIISVVTNHFLTLYIAGGSSITARARTTCSKTRPSHHQSAIG